MPEPMESPFWTGRMLIGILKLSKRAGFRWVGGFFRGEPFEVTVALCEGFSFAPYGVDAKVIELPGHTRGSVGILAADSLVAGDALTNLFPPAGKAALWSDGAATLESARKAGALGDIMIYFGHGEPVMNKEWQL